jgi:hypothetical protein
MKLSTPFTLFLTINFSCGILGIHSSDSSDVNPDPDFKANLMAEINNKPIAKKMDSLIQKIDSAPLRIPDDLAQTTLIIETYKYHDYLKTQENKFHTIEDNKKQRKRFKKYDRNKTLLLSDPICKIIYVDKGEYDNYDLNEFKYVLKTSNRLEYDLDKLIVTNDKHVYPWVILYLYYIENRATRQVFKEITDLSILTKKSNR